MNSGAELDHGHALLRVISRDEIRNERLARQVRVAIRPMGVHPPKKCADVDRMTSSTTLKAATVRELLAMHETALAELRCRGVVRTNDSPSGQYAEWLAQQVLGGTLAPNSEKSYDLLTAERQRIQIKCRVVRHGNAGERQLSPFRTFDFDQALIILFDTSYDVQRAVLLSADLTEQLARWREYVRGFVLIASNDVLTRGNDITAQLSRVV